MTKTLGALTAILVLAVAGGLMIAGCESTSSSESAITVTPPRADLSSSNTVQVFTASMASSNTTLVLPLVWTVSDSSLGVIRSSAGMSAVYESNGTAGNNVVTVRDQGEAEGLAVVNQ